MDYSFGMATVCPPGYAPNKRYRHKRGQRQCLKVRPKKPSLRDFQASQISTTFLSISAARMVWVLLSSL